MPTAASLISEAIQELHGWGSTRDRVTALATSMLSTDLTFTVTTTYGQAVGVSPGVVEIDSELIYVTDADSNTGVCTVAPFGRGYQGTTAAAHTAGVQVTSEPTYPRTQILNQMNEVLGGFFPDLFQVATTTSLTFTFPSDTYTVATSMQNLISVEWQDVNTSDWLRILRARVDPYDNTLRIGDVWIPAGAPLRVMYTKEPGLLTAETDDYATVTGLPASTSDLLVMGAVMRSLPALDMSRSQNTSVEQSDRSRVVPPNSAILAAKDLRDQFNSRLMNEAKALRRRYPPRIARTF